MKNIVIFDRHFLGKSEDDSNFFMIPNQGLRILIIRVYIFDLLWSQIFTTLLLIHLYFSNFKVFVAFWGQNQSLLNKKKDIFFLHFHQTFNNSS